MSRTAAVLTATFGLFAATALPILPGMPEMIPSAAASGTTVTESVSLTGTSPQQITINANDVLKVTFTHTDPGNTTACNLASTTERIAGLTIDPPTPSTGTNLCSPSVQYTFTPSEAGTITWQFGFTSLTVNVLPVITSITPSSGPLAGGDTVTIAGFGFTKATFGSLSWTTSLLLDSDTNNKVPMTFTTATSATAVIPGGAAEGAQNVTVFAELFNNGASMGTFFESTTSTTYTYLPPAPTISSVLPGSGVGPSSGGLGTEVTIRGTNMKGVTGVTFGGVAAQIFFVDNDFGESVAVEAPPGTGTVDVAVTGPGGTATRSNAFTYLPIPTITAISPTTGPDTGGTLVTVTGTNFDPAAMVAGLVLGQDVEIVNLQAGGTSTSVSFVTPAITAGSYTVVVGDPNNPATVAQAAVPFIVTSGGPSPNPNPNPPAPAPATPSNVNTPGPVPVASVLEPVVPGSNPNIPAGGVPLGGSVFLVNGQPAPITVKPNAPSAARATGLDVEGPGFTMRLVGRTANDRPLGVTPDGALILEQDRTAFTEGTGFQPNSEVKLYVFSETRFLGTVNTDASGSFRGSVPLPLDIPAGRHTLQSNGLAPDGAVRSLSLGVQVKAMQVATKAKKRTAKATVMFNALSAKLTPAAKRELRAMAKSRAGSATRTLVVGYVQANDTTANDKSLSTQRARSVARYLRSIGVKGAVITRGQGVAKGRGAAARKAVVTLTYRR